MRFAYADPPYLGCCKLYDHDHGDEFVRDMRPWDGRCWDHISTHQALIQWLNENYDGWAYCMTSNSLRHIIPATDDIPYRIGSWGKPFAAFKRNVRIAYTWEPVLFSPGRDRSADGAPVGRDHLSEPIQMRAGFTGAKPQRFNRWVLDLVGFIDEEDTLDDLFPGSGGMERTLAAPRLPLPQAVAERDRRLWEASRMTPEQLTLDLPAARTARDDGITSDGWCAEHSTGAGPVYCLNPQEFDTLRAMKP